MRNKHGPEIIVIDPRKTETAMAATQHYAIQPKSDLTLLYGVANILIASSWIDRPYIDAHTNGFDEFAQFVTHFTTDLVSAATGLEADDIWHLAQTIADGKRVSFWWTMGVNQGHEATRTAQAIINLALMTGNIGRPGTGANSITGQCNAMGSRLFANVTSLLGGHAFDNDADRAKVAGVLHIPESVIPRRNSWAYDQIVDGIQEGKIKALWIIATNSSHSWINQRGFNEILKNLDFLVVQDMYHTTETAQRADLVLPAAGWGEKDGTLINSERRIGLVKKVSRAPGQALSDFNIFKLIAQYWGCGEMFSRWSSPEAVFLLLKELSRGQPCDITGIEDYRMIDELGGIQWPWSESSTRQTGIHETAPPASPSQNAADLVTAVVTPPPRQRRLFEDGRYYHADERARFIFEQPRPAPEPPDSEYPLLLLTGRGTSSQWHTQSRTGKSDVLRQLYPATIYAEINPLDAARLGIEANTLITIASRRGKITASAFLTTTVQPGQIFIPMHYPQTNELTYPTFDPYSRQPSYKACAVAIAPL
jgi:anaerobic selenocysteine-containing dehydrogenase